MRHLYLYGASDDCMECDVWADGEGQKGFGSYHGLVINGVRAHYVFDGDWGIWLEGQFPQDWVVTAIRANCAAEVRSKPYGGQFIHIIVPEDAELVIEELEA